MDQQQGREYVALVQLSQEGLIEPVIDKTDEMLELVTLIETRKQILLIRGKRKNNISLAYKREQG